MRVKFLNKEDAKNEARFHSETVAANLETAYFSKIGLLMHPEGDIQTSLVHLRDALNYLTEQGAIVK